MYYGYKRNDADQMLEHKSRFSVRGDHMLSHLHCNPNKTAAKRLRSQRSISFLQSRQHTKWKLSILTYTVQSCMKNTQKSTRCMLYNRENSTAPLHTRLLLGASAEINIVQNQGTPTLRRCGAFSWINCHQLTLAYFQAQEDNFDTYMYIYRRFPCSIYFPQWYKSLLYNNEK